MMDWLLAKLEKEWRVIRRVPIHFSALVVLAFLTTGLLMRWWYKEQLSAKDELISSYRDRFGLRSTTRYSGMENEELKTDTFRLVAHIRTNADDFEANDEKLIAAFGDQLSEGKSNQAKTQILTQQYKYLREHSSDFSKYFERRFRSDVMNARDELVRRLPPEERLQFDSLDDNARDSPQAREIAARLEQMAKLLP